MNVTAILVHGAWADASSWSKVIIQLQAKGVEVYGVQLPLTSLKDDIEATRRCIKAVTAGPVVLVGHSYGGAVITGAGLGEQKVQALVYISAFGPDAGENLDSLSKQGPASPGAAAISPDAEGFLWIGREKFREAFAADATESEAYVMAAVQRPLRVSCFVDRSEAPAWKTVPSWYLIATNDMMISPQAQLFMADRMGATIKQVPSSHAVMISYAQAVTDVIMLAVNAVDAARPRLGCESPA